MFHFNHEKFDFWSIYNAIVHFYPIGVKKDESKLFFDYPGYKELEQIIVDEIHDNEKYNRWEVFSEEISKVTNRQVIGTTYARVPSLSAYLELEKTILDDLTRTKELHFYVSLLGPFYTVFGQDRNTISIENGGSWFSTNYFVVSPEKEFAESFNILCEKIENRFEGYRFVPFYIYEQKLNDLFISYWNENAGGSVFHALFNNTIDFDNVQIVGQDFHKSDNWIKEGYVDSGARWISYPTDELRP